MRGPATPMKLDIGPRLAQGPDDTGGQLIAGEGSLATMPMRIGATGSAHKAAGAIGDKFRQMIDLRTPRACMATRASASRFGTYRAGGSPA
jgi:hypothetical protein